MGFKYKRRIAWVSFVILVIGGGSGWWYITTQNMEMERASVVSTKHHRVVIATGNTEAKKDVLLAFERSGQVTNVPYEAGQYIRAGDVVASLNTGTLQAEIEAQKAQVEKATIKLNGFIEGPEKLERERVQAKTNLSFQTLHSTSQTALVSAQRTAGDVETLIRRKVDVLFTGIPNNPRINNKYISAIETDKINSVRGRLELVFTGWREWANEDVESPAQIVVLLKRLKKELRLVNTLATTLYDTLLSSRSLNENAEKMFLVVMDLKVEVLRHLLMIEKDISGVETEMARYRLALAQSKETLSGSTKTDQLAQQAQVETEQKRVRQFELQLAKTRIHAPFNGVIGEVFVDVGEFVDSGKKVLRFISEGDFVLSVNVTEIEVQNLVIGQTMKAVLEANNKELKVRVHTIDQTEKKVSDVPVYTALFEVIQGGELLRPGMTVDVFIPSGEEKDVLAVPSDAISKPDKNGHQSVIVERENEQTHVNVKVGSYIEDTLMIVEGDLVEGDVVVFNKNKK